MNGTNADILNSIIGIVSGTHIWNGPLWFLPCLFIIELLYYFLNEIHKYLLVMIIMISLSGIALAFFRDSPSLFHLDVSIVMVLFFHLGCLYKKYVYKSVNILSYFIAIISLIINLTAGMVLNTIVSVSGSNYGNFLFFYVASISGVLFYIVVAKLMSRIRLISIVLGKMGQASIYILTTHWFVITVLDFIQNRYISLIGIPIIKVFVILIIEIPIIYV